MFDNDCGDHPQNYTSSGVITIDHTNGSWITAVVDDQEEVNIGDGWIESTRCLEKEMQQAYVFSKKYSITTMPDCIAANMYWSLYRRDAAKMISNFAINILHRTPNKQTQCEFWDIKGVSSEYQKYIKLACELGLMWINNMTNEVNTFFYPDEYVDTAQWWTMLSRLLYGNTYNGEDNEWYKKHLEKLQEIWVLTIKNENIFQTLYRWWAMLMLLRLQ